MAEPTLVDGIATESVSVRQRALQYGDGLFETISCREGRPRWLALHLARLARGCERLQLPFRAYAALTEEIQTLAAGQTRCVVKVIVSRGLATQRGYAVRGEIQPTRIVSRHPWPATATDRPLQVGISSVTLGENPALAGLKHLNRLEQVLAQLARPKDLDEVLMLSSSRRLIGGSMSNVFLADETGLSTPALTECGVDGVMRRVILQALAAGEGSGAAGTPAGTPAETPADTRHAGTRPAGPPAVRIRAVGEGELSRAREIFVTNVCWGVASVARLDGRALPSDDWAQRIRRLLDATGA